MNFGTKIKVFPGARRQIVKRPRAGQILGPSPSLHTPPAALKRGGLPCRGGWISCHFSIDISLCIGYYAILAPVKDVARRHTASWERGRCPRAELQSAPGRLGSQPPGMMTGMGGASLGW